MRFLKKIHKRLWSIEARLRVIEKQTGLSLKDYGHRAALVDHYRRLARDAMPPGGGLTEAKLSIAILQNTLDWCEELSMRRQAEQLKIEIQARKERWGIK